MKKAIAKAAALIMSAMLAVQTAVTVGMPSAVYAAEETDSPKMSHKMKKALKVAEERVTIPEELSELDTDFYPVLNDYRFTWHTPDGSEEYKSVEVHVSGNIITFYDSGIPENQTEEPCFAKLTEEQLLKKAKEYAKKLNPTIYNKMTFVSVSRVLYSNEATVRFRRYVNGMDASSFGSIDLDKNTGELLRSSCFWAKTDYPDPDRALSAEKIKKIFRKSCTLTPYYTIGYEYDLMTGKYECRAQLVYEFEYDGMINAMTGIPFIFADEYEKNAGGMTAEIIADISISHGTGGKASIASAKAEPSVSAASGSQKTEDTEDSVKLLSDEELFEILKNNKAVDIDESYRLRNRYENSLSSDWNGNKIYESNLSYELDEDVSDRYGEVFLVVNGETGEILRICKSDYRSSDKLPKLDSEKAAAAADEGLKHILNGIASQYKPAEESNHGKIKEYIYRRCVNGIFVKHDINRIDQALIRVDSLGNVTDYEADHKEDVEFPSADRIPEDEMTDMILERTYMYYQTEKNKYGSIYACLVCDIDDSPPSRKKDGGFCHYLNAKTGEFCNYDGSRRYGSDPRYADYEDIEGIPQEEAIRALQSYNIGVTAEDKFDPNAVITEGEFVFLLCSAFGERAETVKKALQEYETDGKTTRKEAAVMFAKMYAPNGLAEENEAFGTPFGDVKSTDENAGYIAIAYAKGFISKSSDGKLNGGHKITRAEAVQMVYDYLQFISK